MSESKDFIVLGFESCFDVGLTDDATDFGLELIDFATISLKTVGGNYILPVIDESWEPYQSSKLSPK